MNVEQDLLFVGMGTTAVSWYRVHLPALALGCDHVGFYGVPPKVSYATGIVQGESKMPDFSRYKVVVLQQPFGSGWLAVIRELQSHDIKVIYEVDDWLHAIRHQKDHDWSKDFGKRQLADYEMCMKAADAMIVSTEFIKGVYRHFNKRVFVCENGVDVARYDLERPGRRTVNIGWAGATGHRDAILPWLKAVAKVMLDYEHVNFISIGQPFAMGFWERFGRERATAVPFATIEQYPAAMTAFDIALGPAAHTGFYRGKSDLRWLEAGALGVPLVGHPLVYPRIIDRATGLHARNPDEVETALRTLVDDLPLRQHIGDQVRRYVRDQRSADVAAQQWARAAEEVVNEA